jgi:hypothetical protein
MPRKFMAAVMLVLLGVGATGCSTLFGGEENKREIRRIAILPFAFRDAERTVPCTLCPDKLVLAETSEEDALLVTAFFHEALTTYPVLTVLSSESVERFRTEDMAESVDRIFAVEAVDAVLIGALMELRPVTFQRASEIISGEPIRWRSALGQAQIYTEQLAKEMAKHIR